ncbi:peptidoglycan-binding domain-containing protein, partial [Nostoc sp. NIES-2111]
MEAAAVEHPDLWGENGFLGGWVATKALVGEIDSAWSRMLLAHDRSSDWTLQGCVLPVPLDACPERSKRALSFPEALRAHLLEHGYPVPVEPGQTATIPSPPVGTSAPPVVDYASAQAAFDALPLADRYEAQTFLAALGYWPAVSSDRFNRKIYEAVQAYQREQGRPATGFVDEATLSGLRSGAYPVLTRWALEPVRHPSTAARLWVPRGLGLIQTTTATGLRFVAADHSVQTDFDFIPD